MWKLHILFKDNKKDNMMEFLEEVSPQDLTKSLRIMYKKPVKDLATAFLNGLEKSGFFSFEEFVETIR